MIETEQKRLKNHYKCPKKSFWEVCLQRGAVCFGQRLATAHTLAKEVQSWYTKREKNATAQEDPYDL